MEIRKILIAFIVAAAIYFLAIRFLIYQHSILIAAIFFMVVLWTNEGLSLGIVSLFPLILFPLFGVSEFESTVPNYFQPVILLFIGGMLLALSIEKSGLHRFIAKKIVHLFPKTPRGLVYSLAITSAIMSAFLSNTTVALMLLPIALFLSKDSKIRVMLLLAVAYGASIGGILTPIGTPPNIIYLGFLNKIGGSVSFFQWIFLMMPLTVLMLVFVPYVISFGAPKIRLHDVKPGKLDWKQKKLVFILISLIVLLLANSRIGNYRGLGLNENYILFVFGVLMFLPGFRYLEFKDLKKFPIGIILLFGAGFAIAFGLSNTGLVGLMANKLQIISSLPLILMIGLIVFVVIAMTELTSNTALASVMIPTVYGFAQASNFNTGFIMLVPVIAASMAFMLPIATPPNAIILSSGEIKVKDMIKKGFIVNIIALVLITLVAYFYWRFVLGIWL